MHFLGQVGQLLLGKPVKILGAVDLVEQAHEVLV
jgi:hypothetical protein